MALPSATVQYSLDEAFNRLLVDGGMPFGVLGPNPFTQLLKQGLQGLVFGANLQTGASYTATVNDTVILMNDDAVRTLTLPIGPVGTVYIVVDNSLSVTAGHTLTVSPASGAIWSGGAPTLLPLLHQEQTVF